MPEEEELRIKTSRYGPVGKLTRYLGWVGARLSPALAVSLDFGSRTSVLSNSGFG